MEKGFYIAADEREEIGFSIGLVYMPERKDLQLTIMIGSYMVAVGCVF